MELKILEQGLKIKGILSLDNFCHWDEFQTLNSEFSEFGCLFAKTDANTWQLLTSTPQKASLTVLPWGTALAKTRSSARTDILSLSNKSRVHSEP